MKYTEFLAAIKGAKSGDKAIFSGEWLNDNKEIIKVKYRECVLEKDRYNDWFICQNYWKGASCKNKRGKKYSFVVNGTESASHISSILLVNKTNKPDIQKVAKKPTPKFKLGDIYPEWEKLKGLPYCTWEQLKKSHGVNEDTLFVAVNCWHFAKGKIIKLKMDDRSYSPSFIDELDFEYERISHLAILPNQPKTTDKPATPPTPQLYIKFSGDFKTVADLEALYAESLGRSEKEKELRKQIKQAKSLFNSK